MTDRRVRLTKRLVESLPPPTRVGFLWDREVTGFGLKLSPSGLRTYVLQYRHAGRSRRYTIGRHGSPWTPEAARARARELLGQAASGLDPQAEKAKARRALTVAELCDLYILEGLVTGKPASVASARSDAENHIKPLLGRRAAGDVGRADVERLLIAVSLGRTARAGPDGRRGVRGGRGAANAAVTTLSAAFSFGMARGLVAGNPAYGVRKFPERRIERYLSPAELARLGEALASAEALGVESPYALAAIRLLLLTGCRKNEILGLRRSQVDRHHRCLRLSDSKTGPRIAHLGPAALEVIDRLPVLAGNPYLLPGRDGHGRIADLKSVWGRIRQAAGLEDVRLHDLRHAFASVSAAGGDSLVIIGALLGHRSPRTTERYAHLADHPVRAAAERVSGDIARLLGAPQAPRASLDPHEGTAPPPQPGQAVAARWLDAPAAAAFLGLSAGTLATYRWMGIGPPHRRVRRRIVYPLADLQAWAAARERQAAPGAG